MSPNTNQLIAQIKLAEMQRQRERLTKHYQTVEEKALAAETPIKRLEIFYEGLRQAQFAQKPLHPDVANLDVIFLENLTGNSSAEMIKKWTQQFQRELERGRLRAEYACAFGQLLDEWINPPQTEKEQTSLGEESEPWRLLLQPPPDSVNVSLLKGIFQENEKYLSKMRQSLGKFGEEAALKPATQQEVKALLNFQGRDDFRQPHLRRQALEASRSDTLINEIADTLTILLNNLDDWYWPEEGIQPTSVWKNQKWRPYLNESLMQLLFVQLIGLRWGMKLKESSREIFNPRWGRSSFFWKDEWKKLTHYQSSILSERNHRAGDFFLPMIPRTLTEWAGRDTGYGRGRQPLNQPTHLEKLLVALDAEIRFHQAAYPSKPLHIVQADIRDYYLRIPHDVLKVLVDQLGFPQRWQNFLAKYFAIPLITNEGKVPAQRGLILGHLIGSVLADCLLFLLEMQVFQATELRLFRVVDDLFLHTADAQKAQQGWEQIQSFCSSCGLEINSEKSGAVCIGDTKADSLPEGLPHWGLLQLNEEGEWKVDETQVNTLQESIRQEVSAAPTVLGKVACYNENIAFINKNLGLSAPLGMERLEEAARSLARFHNHLFDDNCGMVEELGHLLEKFFLDTRLQDSGVPESLLYWPITAGGLGLTHPLISVSGFRKYQEKTPRKEPPERDEKTAPDTEINAAMYQYFLNIIRPLQMDGPTSTPGMEGLVKDFIARGGEVGGREQKGLSPYWQWIVYTYGPAVLESLGTFRFLLTELVPLQLIFEGRIDVPSLSATSEGIN